MAQCIKLQILTTFLLLSIFVVNTTSGQTVGVVLSGGGSSGLAHIGVLKALEDNQIPIDYITGTSMGAVIGGLYASGKSLEEIESFFISKNFNEALTGDIEDKYAYFYQKSLDDATWVSLKTNRDTVFGKILPTNVLSPVQLDLALVEYLSAASAISNYSFDSLFVPFRCVAADIQRKKQVVFDSGELHTALRASSTYPFFFRPIFVDGQLLFDGGLYNNFPSDVLYNEFSPDFIIGSNVSSNANEPDPDNLFSQLENMISSPTNFNLPCKEGIIISPKTESFTLDFSNPEKNIYTGYYSALNSIDSIRTMVKRRVSKNEVDIKRALFLDSAPEFRIKNITLTGEKDSYLKYFQEIMTKKEGQDFMTFEEWKTKYIQIFEDDKVAYLFPEVKYNKQDSAYDMSVRLHKEKELVLNFGGNISSRPVNMGFLGLKYNIFGKIPKTFTAKSHFGKFYSAVNLKFRFDFHKKRPFYLETEGLIQQWDYFKSFATFFEETKPPFILQLDEFIGINIGTAIRNKGVLVLDTKIGRNENNYYQIDNFSPADTADLTTLDFFSGGLTWTRSTLNKKQFANEGTHLRFSGRYNNAIDFTVPGSTGVIEEESKSTHQWLTFRIDYENYFKTIKKLKLGYSLSGGFSTIPLFSNYKSTILAAPSYQPIPESRTFFQEEFRAHEFGAMGLKFIYSPIKAIDFRLESYVFQPIRTILEDDNKLAFYEEPFLRRYYIISTTAVFHSPIGPLSFAVNYYDKRDQNFSWILNFGYLLFNKRSLD